MIVALLSRSVFCRGVHWTLGALLLLGCAAAPAYLLSPREYRAAKERVEGLNRARDPEALYRNELAQRRLPESGITGALVIHGGGQMNADVIRTFVELAGGRSARLVVITTAGERDPRCCDVLPERWRKLPLASVKLLHARERSLSSAPELIARLRDATGVWFEGGWHGILAERYVGTPIEDEILALLRRGAVVGGTSAGAGIQSRLMLALGQRGEAFTAVGLDLLPGSVVDQHFSQRGHIARLRTVIESHPAVFGLGIDESTAVIVQGREVRVLGNGTVTLLTRPGGGAEQLRVLRDGERFDFVEVHASLQAVSAR